MPDIENPTDQDDVEGHKRAEFADDDVEGHRQGKFSDDDDVEGHRQGKFSDDDVEGPGLRF